MRKYIFDIARCVFASDTSRHLKVTLQTNIHSEKAISPSKSTIFISTEKNLSKMILKIQPGLPKTVHLSKRKLGGKYVEVLENDLKQFKPLRVNDKMSSKAITTDGIEPAYLISENAVKQFSYRNRAKLNVGKDPIDGLLNLKQDPQYIPV